MEKKKEKKVIELELLDNVEDSGVSAVALVSDPAIEKFWVYMKKHSFVKPKSGEREKDYIPRCMSVLVGDEGYEQDQAAAICYSTWREAHESVKLAEYPWEQCIKDAKAQGADDPEALCGWIKWNMTSQKFAEYPWDECQKDMEARGYNQESRDKLCGWIRANMSVDTASLPPYVDQTQKKKRKFNEYGCPASTVDIELNLANRQEAIEAANYGPLNPNEPNEEYWQAKADKFNTTIEDAKSAKCGNCGFFVRTKEMLACIAAGIGEEALADPYDAISAGELGYCEAFDFKCAADRTCDAWIAGGPITEELKKADDPCWAGYEQYGTKEVDGKEVPNCIPIKSSKLAFALEKDKQIVVGPVAIPNIEIVRRDEETGEKYFVKFSEETIQRMQEKFMKELRIRDTNIEHNENKNANSYVFESWIVEDPKTDKANTIYKLGLPKGTWAVKMRVQDPEVWKGVKEGKFKGFSLEGNFVDKEDLEVLEKDKAMIESIMNILKN